MPIKTASRRSHFQSIIARSTSVLSVVAALLGMIFSLWQFGVGRNQSLEARLNANRMEADTALATRREAERAARAAEELRLEAIEQRAQLEHLLDHLQSGPKSERPLIAKLDPRDKEALENVRAAQATLDQKMKTLEAAIMSDPVKAVSLPLMRKDLDSLQDNRKAISMPFAASLLGFTALSNGSSA